MKITNKNKRGFTLVELIVVIAIVAILAAVSVVSYMAFINQANVSNDTQIVKELNTILQGDEALHGTRDTYHEVLEVVGDNGFLVEKLTPRTNGYRIVYDRAHNRFALLNEEDKPVYEDTGSRHYEYVLGEVWNIVNKGETLSDKFANYLGESYDFKGNTVVEITTGLDVGNHTERRDIKYVGQLGAQHPISGSQHAIVRTMGGTFTVENSQDDVTHYGLSTEVSVKDVKQNTYKEFGTVGRLYYEDDEGGIQLLKKDDSAVFCYMNKTDDENANKANAAAQNATVYTWVDSGVNAASGYATGTTISPVTVSESEVSVASCHNHNAAGNYELIRIGDLQYIICKACGGFALYEGENSMPVEHSEAIDPEDQESAFDYDPVSLNRTYGFYDSYVEDGHWVHEIDDRHHFVNISKHRYDYTNPNSQKYNKAEYPIVVDGANLADKTTVYKIRRNINFGGNIYGADTLSVRSTPFTGILTADQMVTLSNVQLYNTLPGITATSGDPELFGLFDRLVDSEIKNITLSNFRLENTNAKPVGLFAIGQDESNVDLTKDNYYKFENCVVDSTCNVLGLSGCGGFIGHARNVGIVSFKNCKNYANVTATNHSACGFVGSATGQSWGETGPTSITFEDCENHGTLKAPYRVAGLIGYCSKGTDNGPRTIKIKNCVNTGDIINYCGGDNGKYVGMFLVENPEVSSESTGNVNTGKIYTTQTQINSILEKGYLDNLKIEDASHTQITASNYSSYCAACATKALTISFNGDHGQIQVSDQVDCDSISIVVRLHCIRLKFDDGTEDPGAQGGETWYSIAFNFNNWSSLADIRRVNQCGFFIPTGAESPHASYDAGFDDYILSGSGAEFADGYHAREENSYIVIANNDASSSGSYFAVSEWRNKVDYSIIAYKNGQEVGFGYKVDHTVPGNINLTTLEPISF